MFLLFRNIVSHSRIEKWMIQNLVRSWKFSQSVQNHGRREGTIKNDIALVCATDICNIELVGNVNVTVDVKVEYLGCCFSSWCRSFVGCVIIERNPNADSIDVGKETSTVFYMWKVLQYFQAFDYFFLEFPPLHFPHSLKLASLSTTFFPFVIRGKCRDNTILSYVLLMENTVYSHHLLVN